MNTGLDYPKLCPSCGRPVQEMRFGVAFTQLQASIIDKIKRRPGIVAKDLLEGKNANTAKAHVYHINQKLIGTGRRLWGSKWGYRLCECEW